MIVCSNCGQKISKREDFCPCCNSKIIYKCKCGKEFPNSQYTKCPECKSKDFKRNKLIIAIGIVLITGSLILIPDPFILIDELAIGAIGVILSIINLIRREKE